MFTTILLGAVFVSSIQLSALILVKPPPPEDSLPSGGTQRVEYDTPIKFPWMTERNSQYVWSSTDKPNESFPYFDDDELFTNVSAQLGEDVYLHCYVNDLGDKTVSWLKKNGQNFELLTFGHLTYSSEERYSLSYSEPNDWRLFVRSAQDKDTGLYECQVSSHPPIARCTNLIVLVPIVEIVDNEGRSVAERFYQKGSTIELTCVASEAPRTLSTRLIWLHGTRPLNHDTVRGGISVKTEPVPGGIISRLFVAGARRSDAGLYSCVVGDIRAAVVVHVLTGEHADAMQYGSGERMSSNYLVLFIASISIFRYSCLDIIFPDAFSR